MRYRSSYHSSSWWEVIILFTIAILIILGFNACTASEWNDGVCPECHMRYELRGVSRGMKYYSCPECGNEVERY